MKKNKKIRYLYAAFIVELLLIFYLRNDAGYLASPVLIMGSGIFLAVWPYFIFREEAANAPLEATDTAAGMRATKRKAWIIFGTLSLVFVGYSYFIFTGDPVNIAQSDIIPFIRDVMVKRFLGHENVYAPVQFNNYPVTFTPNYLPFQWSPFSIAVLLNIDLRWIYVFAFIGSTAYYVYRNCQHPQTTLLAMLNTLLPFAVVFSIYLKQPRDAAHTIEIMIMSYYLFLSLALFSKYNLVRALGLTFPALSRFSFVFWLPVYFYTLLRTHMGKFFGIGFLFAALVSLFFIIPFVLPDPGFLKHFNDIYLDGALGEWNGQSWQQPGDRPFQLFQGMGFASWFYFFFEGSLTDKILALKTTLMISCIVSALIPVLLFHKARKVVSQEMFALLALKFCLTLFYAFILVPYIYLFWVPLMVSVAIVSRTGYEVK